MKYLKEVFLIIRRGAGHSKWQNIRHVKSLKDGQRSLLFVRLSQKIRIAIQENGNNADPYTNVQLSQAIEVAKKNDMPNATILGNIKSFQAEKEGAKSHRFSVKGPKGSILLLTTLTNSYKRTQQELCTILKKVGGNMSDQVLDGHFDKKGVIIASPPADLENVEETSVDHAIEAGAEEVSLDEGNKLAFYCGFTELHKVKNKLQEMNYKVEESSIKFIPKIAVFLTDSEMELMNKIATKLEEHPDVVEIHDNIG